MEVRLQDIIVDNIFYNEGISACNFAANSDFVCFVIHSKGNLSFWEVTWNSRNWPIRCPNSSLWHHCDGQNILSIIPYSLYDFKLTVTSTCIYILMDAVLKLANWPYPTKHLHTPSTHPTHPHTHLLKRDVACIHKKCKIPLKPRLTWDHTRNSLLLFSSACNGLISSPSLSTYCYHSYRVSVYQFVHQSICKWHLFAWCTFWCILILLSISYFASLFSFCAINPHPPEVFFVTYHPKGG